MATVAPHAEAMPRSGIRTIMDLAWQLPGPVIGLHVGEPSFPTPPHVIEGASRALAEGRTRYVPNGGVPELRDALAARARERNGLDATADRIVVTAGGAQALHLAFASVLRVDDEVLIPDPGWPNFAMGVQLLQAKPVRYRLRAERSFLPDPAELSALVTPRTRAVVVNSPSNPLGTVLAEDLLRRLVEFAHEYDLWLISDECYEEIIFAPPHLSPASIDRDGRVLSCFSFSKTYAMTGLRVGWLVAPPCTALPWAKMQEPLLSCVNAPAQYGALAALTGPQDQVALARETYRERRDAATRLLDRLAVPYLRPDGAFYLWVDVSARCGPDVADWAVRLLRDRGVAVAPGTAFGPGGAGWVRVSLATETDDLLEGLTRLAGYG